ncbi:Hypothetical protein R9X50_00279400 [Acrodontium crateriforme]|uniref:DM2 domain-containing protein n=1 Tax=Acrodontium crateriforme TaxID=150365 RepID=A0AAQ3R8W1_9PEZI|nr:Hypothetical protein R9X50_00279400 [Acrodontium crateriforme]
MQNYRNFQQPVQRSPHASQSTRRGPMAAPSNSYPPQPQVNPAQLQQQHLDAMRRADAARRIAKKPTDRDLPAEELEDVVVGDGVDRYGKLRAVEKKVDAVMMRKRLDISDNMQRRYTRSEGILRVWISNTAEGQPWQVVEDGGGMNEDGTFEFGENSSATFRVKIEGRLLDDPLDTPKQEKEQETESGEGEGEKAVQKPAQQRPRFSDFFKAITIDFSRSAALQPDGYSAIEWRKPVAGPQTPSVKPNSPEISFDTLEFERKSDENINVTVNLVRDEKNERFKLSPILAEILDTEEEDRAGVVQGIWEYCRAMGLQEDEDKRSIVCNEPLRQLFNKDSIYFPFVPDLLHPHLLPLPPIQLKYTIRVDKSYIKGSTDSNPSIQPSAPTIYDLRVPLPNPLVHELSRFHTSKSHMSDLQNIVKIDDDLALLVQKIHQTNAKRKFYENLAKDPTSFIKRWISSQQRDLEVVLAEGMRGGGEDANGLGGTGEEWRRGGDQGVWGSQLAKESVGLWLARNTKAH